MAVQNQKFSDRVGPAPPSPVAHSRACPQPLYPANLGAAVRRQQSPPASSSVAAPTTRFPAGGEALEGRAVLRAELAASYAREAELEAAVARKRSLALLQANWIDSLKRRAEELQVRNGPPLPVVAPVALMHDRVGPAPGGDPDASPSEAEPVERNDDGDASSRAEREDDLSSSGAERREREARSLEVARDRLAMLPDLRLQVRCLEEELAARAVEADRLRGELCVRTPSSVQGCRTEAVTALGTFGRQYTH